MKMSLLDRIQTDIVTAMKAKDELTLNTLRSVKTALDRYRVDQRKPIDESAEQSLLGTLAKQRNEAAEAFRSGGRKEAADKEMAELSILERYMLQEASDAELDTAIETVIVEMATTDNGPITKKMGLIIKATQNKLQGKRVNGKLLAEKVKTRICV